MQAAVAGVFGKVNRKLARKLKRQARRAQTEAAERRQRAIKPSTKFASESTLP